MNDRLIRKPVMFDHPEKLVNGVSLVEDDIQAKAFITEEDGCVKFNIVVENKVTGKTAQKDIVIGEIDTNTDTDDDIDTDTYRDTY